MPSIVEKINVPKIILFIEIKDSFENDVISFFEANNGNLYENRIRDEKTKIPVKLKRYNPLSGSFAKEWTLSMIPDLTINAPNRLSEKTMIDKRIVQILKSCDLEETLSEWINAVAASHGMRATFSTGSQNQ